MNKRQYKEQVNACNYGHGLEFIDGLDPQIQTIVNLLRSQGVQTCQSCQGGNGHSYSEPTVDFYGNNHSGWKALSVALSYNMPIQSLYHKWDIENGFVVGPLWSLVFIKSKLDNFNNSWK